MSNLREQNLQELKAFDKSFGVPINGLAGMDEAGRGAWMGPVVAACVILPQDFDVLGINDSKKVKVEDRERLVIQIKEKCLAWGVGMVQSDEIERIGIQQANFLAFKLALEEMERNFGLTPILTLIDGTYSNVPLDNYVSVKKGDTLSVAIAASSLLAKVERDHFVSTVCHAGNEEYMFPKHKGYGTKIHQEAIREYGLTPWHRPSFCKKYLNQIEKEVLANES